MFPISYFYSFLRAPIKGEDSQGVVYDSLENMWTSEIGSDSTKREKWYKQGVDYWINTDATIDGVLGGYGAISDIDIQGSREFLLSLPNIDFNGAAADCGAGIGRISQQLLCPLFKKVDVVDPVPKYIETAKEKLANTTSQNRFFVKGLEEWEPDASFYSVIWCQWVMPCLIDDDLVTFLKRCIPSLAANGVIIAKENTSRDGFILDREDTSITRTDRQYRNIFAKAGLQIVAEKLQVGFPRTLFPVRMYVLRPKAVVEQNQTDENQTDQQDDIESAAAQQA